MNEQLNILLQESHNHYKSRQLKKALNTAQIVLEFEKKGNAEKIGIIKTKLLLSKIYTTNGQYQNEPSFYRKALHCIEQCDQLNKTLKDERITVAIHMQSGKIYGCLKKYDLAEIHLNNSLSVAKKINHSEGIIYALAALSQINLHKNQVGQAINLAEAALTRLNKELKSNQHELQNEVYLQLSQAYLKKQEYSRSLEVSQHLVRSAKEIGDIEKEIIGLRNIAIICGAKSNYKIGMQYFLEAINKCKAIGYRELYAQLQINIGTLYAHLYNYPEAIKTYELVLTKNEDLLDNASQLVVYNNLGNIYLSTHHPEKALTCFQQSYQLANGEDLAAMQAHALAQLSRTNLQMGQLPEAKNNALQARPLKISKPGSLFQQIFSSKCLVAR